MALCFPYVRSYLVLQIFLFLRLAEEICVAALWYYRHANPLEGNDALYLFVYEGVSVVYIYFIGIYLCYIQYLLLQQYTY